MSDSEETPLPAAAPKRVGRGLEGLDVDTTKMSQETLEIYQNYLAVVSDESPGDNEKRLQKAEHDLRGALEADKFNRELGQGQKPPDVPA